MIRWVIAIFVILLLVNWFAPALQKLRFGRLPGDFRFRMFGRDMVLPVTTTLLLSFAASAIARYV